MKPTQADLAERCPGVPRTVLAAHLARLDARYFAACDAETAAAHVRAVAALSAASPLRAWAEPGEGGTLVLTVVAYDYPGEFSLLAGVLAGTGFEVVSGDVFTYRPPAPGARGGGGRRCIVDTFRGRLADADV
ncbi:MAG: hypothetical protein JW951_01700, partial [Lentisphaerae bacterium]|nr:hypothetical protein [Lentisphaerota bacterium]